MLITFLAPTSPHPVGGLVAIYEFANALARVGHEVRLVHIDAGGGRLESPDQITWWALDSGLRHEFPPDLSPEYLPDGEFLFGFGGEYPSRCGLPLLLVQGYRTMTRNVEHALMTGPYPKLCVSRWLVDVCRSLGATEEQTVHIPCGLNHRKYRVISPIEKRPLRVAMAYNVHLTKGPKRGLEALSDVTRRVPDAEVVVFGATDPIHDIPSRVTYVNSPSQDAIVGEIYNQSRVFLNSSLWDGFGLSSIEAMACGCALVTTDNGGSRDYAFHRETALVAPPERTKAVLADYIEGLLRDDHMRLRLARTGRRFVRRYDWDESARRVEAFLDQYAAEPLRYQAEQPAWRELMNQLSDETARLSGPSRLLDQPGPSRAEGGR